MIGRGERFWFVVGDIFGGGGAALISVLYFIFLTEVVGLPPAHAGTVVFVAKLWDAANDPLVGMLSDRTRTRWGRRRPWIFASGLLVMVSMALMWMPTPPVAHEPVALTFWAMGTYIIYTTVQTAIVVPYLSLSTELTPDPEVRARLNLTRLLLSSIASAVVTLTASQLLEAHRAGRLDATGMYAWIVLVFGGLFTVVTVGVAVGCRERLGPSSSTPERRDWFAGLRHRPMRLLMVIYLGHTLAMDTISAMILFYSGHVVPEVSPTVFLGLFIAVNVLAYPLVRVLIPRVDKARIHRTLLPVAALAVIALALYPADGPVLGVYGLAVVLACGMAGAQFIIWAMFPDVVDDAECRVGRRDSGAFAGAMTCARGLATAVLMQGIGGVLQLTGYRSGGVAQPATAVDGMRGILLVVVVVLLGGGWLASRAYPLTRDRCARNAHALGLRRAEVE